MVENVGNDGRELGAHALRNVDRFTQAEVHIPVGHAAEIPPAGAARVQTLSVADDCAHVSGAVTVKPQSPENEPIRYHACYFLLWRYPGDLDSV